MDLVIRLKRPGLAGMAVFLQSCSWSLAGNFWESCLKEAPTSFLYNIYLTPNMGNENSAPAQPTEASLIEELCSLTQQDYPFACRLSRDPFRGQRVLDLPSVTQDFPISALVD